MFCNIKDKLNNPAVLKLLVASAYNNSMENAYKRAEEFRSHNNLSIYGWIEDEDVIGVCGFRVYHTDHVEILNIAVTENVRGRGIGSAMIHALQSEFLLPVTAETDNDAVGFYRKVGFDIMNAPAKGGISRWACVLAAPNIIKTIEGLDANKVTIAYMPTITEVQIWEFYVRNDICEAGYGRNLAAKPLQYGNSHTVAAFFEDKLVGIIRALFDGLTMNIVECGLELALQGDNLEHNNGSLIEKDRYSLFKQMGLLLIDEAKKIGCTMVEFTIVENLEESIFQSIGMKHNTGHLPYYIELRPYVQDN